MSIKTFCDLCKKELELTCNVVKNKLVVYSRGFTAEVGIYEWDKETGDYVPHSGDLCHECLMKILTTKPKRKYTRKEKDEQVSTPLGENKSPAKSETKQEKVEAIVPGETNPKRQRKSIAEQSQEISTTPLEEK